MTAEVGVFFAVFFPQPRLSPNIIISHCRDRRAGKKCNKVLYLNLIQPCRDVIYGCGPVHKLTMGFFPWQITFNLP